MEFHIGTNSRSRLRTKTRLTNTNNGASNNPNPILYAKHMDVDPMFLTRKLKQPTPIAWMNQSVGTIQVLIPNPKPEDPLYTIVHTSMTLYRKSFFEWYVDIQERSSDLSQILYGPTYIIIVKEMYAKAQTLRWLYKRLYNAWLHRQCRKRCIGQEDIATRELIPEKERIQVFCMRSRCMYMFSGNTLLRSICANVETQLHALAYPTHPKNPYTNMRFHYGQMVHIYYECLSWCANKKRSFPTFFALYKETNFELPRLTRMNAAYLQHRAMRNFTKNDDMDSSFFLENFADILKTYKSMLIMNKVHLKYIRILLFVNWLRSSPNHPLLRQWKAYVADYVYYSQTDIMPRESWNSLVNIMADFKTLFFASIPHLQVLHTPA